MLLLTLRGIPWNTIVETKPDYDLLTDTTMSLAILVSILALGFAYFVAQNIPNKPDKSDFKNRKIAFFMIGIGIVLIFGLYNYYYVSTYIQIPMLNLEFSSLTSFSYINKMILLIGVIYFGVGYFVSKYSKKNKIGRAFS